LFAIFLENPGKMIPERLHSDCYWSKDDGGDKWSYKNMQSCSQIVTLTNRRPDFTGWMPFLMPNQWSPDTEGMKNHILWTSSP